MGKPTSHDNQTTHMPSSTIDQSASHSFVARLYTPSPLKAKQVEPLTLKAKAAVVKRRQNFVAPAQARRRWLVASIRVKAILRFNKPIPRVCWGGQRLSAVLRFVSQRSFERFLDLPAIESPSLPSTPREPSSSKPSIQENAWSRYPVLPPLARTDMVCGTISQQMVKLGDQQIPKPVGKAPRELSSADANSIHECPLVRWVNFRCPVRERVNSKQTATMPRPGDSGTLAALNILSEPKLQPRAGDGEQGSSASTVNRWSTAKAAGKVGFLSSINQDQRASAKALRAKQDAIRAHDHKSLAARIVLSKWVEEHRGQC